MKQIFIHDSIKQLSFQVMVILLLCFGFIHTTQAAIYDFQPSVGDWNTAGNWKLNGATTTTVPGVSDFAMITNNSTCNLDVTTTVTRVIVGNDANSYTPGSGVLNISSGTAVTVTGEMVVGDNDRDGTGETGVLNQTGGSVTLSGSAPLYIGNRGADGTYNISGGTLNVGGRLYIGCTNYGGTAGVLNISGAPSAITTDVLEVRDNGTVKFSFLDSQGVSTIEAASWASISANSNLEIELVSGVSFNTDDVFTLIDGGASLVGEFGNYTDNDIIQIDGLDTFRINYDTNDNNAVTLTALRTISDTAIYDFQPSSDYWSNFGNWKRNGDFTIGLPGPSNFAVIANNSTCTLDTTTSVARVIVGTDNNGSHSPGSGILNVENGYSLTATSEIAIGDKDYSGLGITGTVNQTGGSLATAGSAHMYVGNRGADGTYNISDGTLNVGGRLYIGSTNYGGTAGTLNISGAPSTITTDVLQVRENGTVKFSFVDSQGVSTIEAASWASISTSSNLEIELVPGVSFNTNDVFTLIDGGANLVGEFGNYTDNDIIHIDGLDTFQINYDANNNNAVTLTALRTISDTAIYDFQPSSDYWSNSGNWKRNGDFTIGLPGPSNFAVIANNSTCTLDTTTSVARVIVGTDNNGSHSPGSGILNIDSGYSLTATSEIAIGDKDYSGLGITGTVNQTGGSLATAGSAHMYVGNRGADGTYNISGGTLNVGGRLYIGSTNYGGTAGALNISGAPSTITADILQVRENGTVKFSFIDSQGVSTIEAASWASISTSSNLEIELDLAPGTGFKTNDTFTLIDGGANLSGQFGNYVNDDVIQIDGYDTFRINYDVGNNNLLTLTALRDVSVPFVVVDDGLLVADTSYEVGLPWQQVSGAIQLTGQNNYLYASKSFSPGEFTITARLSLDKIEGTNASFIFDNNMFIFDTPQSDFCSQSGSMSFWGRELIGEGIDGYYGLKNLGLASTYITPGVFFDFEMKCDGQTLEFRINGTLVGSAPYKTQQPHSFGFRPHDATMQISDFSVAGSRSGMATIITPQWIQGTRFIIPAVTKPLAIDSDCRLLLEKRHEITPGTYNAELTPREGGASTVFQLAVDQVSYSDELWPGNDLQQFYVVATLPANILQSAFAYSANSYAAKPFLLSLSRKEETILQQHVILYDPVASVSFPSCGVTTVKGAPTISVNNQPLGMIAGRLSKMERNERFSGMSVNDFGQAGIVTNIITVSPYYFIENGQCDLDALCEYIDVNICRTIANCPDALIWIDWDLYMPQNWCDLYPGEMIELENGGQTLATSPSGGLQPSYASSTWRQDAGIILSNTLSRLELSPWADRIIMLRSKYANAGEWNHWGYKEYQYVDFCDPMQAAFGSWLEDKYGTVAALRSAWGDATVTFTSLDLVPTTSHRTESYPDHLRDGTEGQRAVDYYCFFQQFAVETIEYFAAVAKNATNNRILTGAYYGYYLHHLSNVPWHHQDSGHYGLEYYLDSPYLDFLGGPYPYRDRLNRLQINGLYSSIALHNKIWLSENDMRTHLSADDIQTQYGATDSLEESIAVAKRDFMVNFTKAVSYYFMDFIKDWYLDDEFMQVVTRLKDVETVAQQEGGRYSHAEIAVLFSEDNVSRTSNNPNGITYDCTIRSYQAALQNMFETQMDRTGTPWDIYLASDIDTIDFSPYKLVILANFDYASDTTITKIQSNLFNSGRTVLFLGTPGILASNGLLDYSRSQLFTGIDIDPLTASYYKLESTVPWLPGVNLTQIDFPSDYWISPSLSVRAVVNDSQASTLACFDNTSNVAVAEKDFGTYKTVVFTALAPPEANILRALFDHAGVHIYYDQGTGTDSFYRAGDLLAIYSRDGGSKTIILPTTVEVVMDVFTGNILGQNCSQITLNMPTSPTTLIIFAGTAQDANEYAP